MKEERSLARKESRPSVYEGSVRFMHEPWPCCCQCLRSSVVMTYVVRVHAASASAAGSSVGRTAYVLCVVWGALGHVRCCLGLLRKIANISNTLSDDDTTHMSTSMRILNRSKPQSAINLPHSFLASSSSPLPPPSVPVSIASVSAMATLSIAVSTVPTTCLIVLRVRRSVRVMPSH